MTEPDSSRAGLRPLSFTAFQDIVGGARNWRLWGRLGWLEVKRRYSRTVIGPFWSSITLLVFVIVLGSVGSGLLGRSSQDYLPFLVSGMLVWLMLSTITLEAGSVFISGAGFIRQKNFEYSVLIFALVWRNTIAFFHNLSVYLLIMIIYMPQALTLKLIFVLPALVVLMINGLWIGMVLSVLVARFRDIQQLVGSVVQVAMFVTPLFWPPESLGGIRRLFFVTLNPLFHLLTIVRDPLLGRVPSLESIVAVVIITAAGWALAFAVFHAFRKRIPYWL